MKRFAAYFLYTLLLAAVVCACSDRLDIIQNYDFDLQTLPVPKTVTQNETVEIRCQLVKQGNYIDTRYFIRYFQPDGAGELRLDNGTLLTPNDLFPLTKDVFRLYFTAFTTGQQTIDIYIVDSTGQVVQKTFAFSGNTDTGQSDNTNT